MIEMIWDDLNPPLDARVFRVKNINDLIMNGNFPYNADGVYLTTYEHKNVLMKCHKLYPDNLFSIMDYHKEIMTEFSNKIVNSLMNKACVVVVKTPDKEYIVATELGRAILLGLAHVDLSEDELNFLKYIVSYSEPMNLNEKYSDDEIEIVENDETA